MKLALIIIGGIVIVGLILGIGFAVVHEIIKEQIKEAKTRHGIIALLKKYKPLIDCFTIALANPQKYIEIASHMNDTSLNDVFDGI